MYEYLKKIILDAYNAGYRDGESETMVYGKNDVSEYEDALNYYKQNIDKNNKIKSMIDDMILISSIEAKTKEGIFCKNIAKMSLITTINP